ncbi:hypothetical protein [Thermogemmatispora tikiterensis]|uniref:Uncharacterized protein n=1 Tax=Thermogemmatispora tikiterensis TaxID=1825093 RepID=A0A328VB94_9CHLR|nr:hypothetical protein [Thermogemmatispora tikiterensis]RAQ94049.1 hypothetical protein A4R35_00795 [Thermogemmatispora tikiterensis]
MEPDVLGSAVAGWTALTHFLFVLVAMPVLIAGALARVIPFPDYWLDAVPGMLWAAEGLGMFHPLALYGLNAESKQALPAAWWGMTWGMLLGSWILGIALDWSVGSAMKMLARAVFLSLLLFYIGYLLSTALRRRSQASKAMELYR